MKAITLKEKFTDIIDDRDNHEITDEAAVQQCEKIALDFAKGFGEWIKNHAIDIGKNEWRIYDKNPLDSVLVVKSEDELLTLYQQHLASSNGTIRDAAKT